ncbi:hypothetical protein ABBQ32_008449 [Trebouxia sp. C0010 RCD-2024]
MMFATRFMVSILRRGCVAPILVPTTLARASFRLSRSVVYMVADVIGSCLCDCEKVQMDLSAEDLAHITSHAGLDMNASPLDLIELPWLRPARLNLLVQLQVMARAALTQKTLQRQEAAAGEDSSNPLEKTELVQKVERLEKLLNLTAHPKADDMLGMNEINILQHQASDALVEAACPADRTCLQSNDGLQISTGLRSPCGHHTSTNHHQVLPSDESVKLASDQNMKPLQQLCGPAGAATVVGAISGPFQQSPCPSAPYLSEGRVKEVANIMDIFVPEFNVDKYGKTEQRLSALGIERFTGVNPDKVYVVECICLGIGGFGEVTEGYDECSSAEELEAAAELEFGMQARAWACGVSRIAEPLGGTPLAAAYWSRLLPDQIEWAVLRFAKSALQGLDELDRAGMALGDVKLDNLMVDFAQFRAERGGGPLVKMVDFGFATNAGESSEGGTSDYMAPKQLVWYLDERPVTVKGSPTHHQGLADVYGLGMSLWRLLVAKDPSVDAEDPVLRVLRNQGQTPEEDSDFVALKLKQQLMQHFDDAGQKAAVGYIFEADLEPFSTGLQDLISSMLVDEVSRKPAAVLLNHPILAHLPDL